MIAKRINVDEERQGAPITTASRPEEATVAISVRELVKHYNVGKQKIRVLDDISLDIVGGEFVAIMGASGSGKSTLLQVMGGLDRPTSGCVFVNGTNFDKMSDRQLSSFRNQTIGFVFQFFYLQPFLSVARNIEVAAMPNRMKRQERLERTKQLAAQVGLSEQLGRLPSRLSGGQTQRVAIARALVNRPSIILADEPTGNLDSQTSHEIIDLLLRLRRDLGTTVIIATHDQAIASRADRIVEIKDGLIV